MSRITGICFNPRTYYLSQARWRYEQEKEWLAQGFTGFASASRVEVIRYLALAKGLPESRATLGLPR